MSASSPLRIVLSGGGADAELARHGLGTVHINELMVAIAQQLLSEGHTLAFGGVLTPPAASATRATGTAAAITGPNLTESLIEVTRGWYQKNENLALARGSSRPTGVVPTVAATPPPDAWPLRGYLPWPHSIALTPERAARLVGLVSFIEVLPPGETRASLDKLDETSQTVERSLATWRTLTEMRQRSAKETALRVVMAGKIDGWQGALPGIAEEVLASIEAGKPFVILGGFGGCAELLAEFFARPDAPLPDKLTLDPTSGVKGDRTFEHLRQLPAFSGIIKRRFSVLKDGLERARRDLYKIGPPGGIDATLWHSLLTTTQRREAVQGVRDAARQVAAAGSGSPA